MKRKMTRREDYLKPIYTLSMKGEMRGADLADELNVKRPTVCIYLKRLIEDGDIVMDEHHCVFLTVQGHAIAEVTLDKHGIHGLSTPNCIRTIRKIMLPDVA